MQPVGWSTLGRMTGKEKCGDLVAPEGGNETHSRPQLGDRRQGRRVFPEGGHRKIGLGELRWGVELGV